MKVRRLSVFFVVSFILSCILGGCSGSSGGTVQGNKAPVVGDGIYENAPEKDMLSQGVTDRKLIRNMSIQAETQNLDQILIQLDEQTKSLQGYVEQREVQNGNGMHTNRYATLILRIPTDKLDAFVNHITDATNITFSSENTEDVTLQYAATESKVKALETEEDRLLELLKLAKSLEEILLLEERLADVRSELETIKSQLNVYDNMIDYAKVSLTIHEVVVYTEAGDSLWERISTGFMKSMKNIGTIVTDVFVFFVIMLPYLFIPGVAAGTFILIVHIFKKRKNKKTQNDPQQ